MTDGQIAPYLFFGGRCEEALTFYRETVGAEVQMLMRYKDCPEPMPPGAVPEGYEEKVMHASVRIGKTVMHVSDGGCKEVEQRFAGFSLSLSVPNEDEAHKAFAALADGGEVRMPMGKTFFSSAFGMLTDRFGVGWMVMVNTGNE